MWARFMLDKPTPTAGLVCNYFCPRGNRIEARWPGGREAVDGAGQVSTGQIGLPQPGLAQVGTPQRRAAEIGALQIRPQQRGTG